jgi:hypothetical protein
VIEENQARTEAGEPPLNPQADAFRFIELR